MDIALYVCRELFVKENSLKTIINELEKEKQQKAIRNLFINLEKGTSYGLKNLNVHKKIYDDSLRNYRYENIRYVLFISNQEPTIVFSGLMYPDYDFIGRQLQDLSDLNANLELITFCSAPMKAGWGFLFAWHESSSKICEEFMRSLATVLYERGSISDFLFRLVLNSENHAISPHWWENISNENRKEIIETTSAAFDTFEDIPNSYLMKGLEDIIDWKFNRVLSNY